MAARLAVPGRLRNLTLLGLGFFLLWLAFRGQNPEELLNRLSSANWHWLIWPKVCYIGAHYVRALRWNLLLAPLGHFPRPVHSTVAVMMAYLTNLLIPRLGEVVRCYTLHRTDKIPMNHLLGTVVTERVVDTLSLFFLIAISLSLKASLFSSFFKEKLLEPLLSRQAFSGVAAPAGLALGLLILVAGIFLFFQKNPDNRLSRFFQKLMGGFRQGLFSIFQMPQKGLFLFQTALIWVLYFLSFHLGIYALEATGLLTMVESFFVFTISGLGMAAPVQGGIGAFHWVVMEALVALGIDRPSSLLWATIVHATSTFTVMLTGLWAVVWLVKNGIPIFKEKPGL